jgi:acyl-CoA synthetase (AMP-forming)/AMP-acid ligase II
VRFVEGLGEQRDADWRLSVWQRGAFVELGWDDWRSGAEGCAASLRQRGVGPGTRVACVLTNAPSVCTGAIGIWLAGGTIVSLPTVGRGEGIERYVATLRKICADVEPELLLAEERYAEQLSAPGVLDVPVASFESLESSRHFEPELAGEDEIAFIQYSSGSTSRPKGCMLSGRAISAQLEMLSGRLELAGSDERGVSWLPLSHDMGFFGCLMLSFTYGMRLVLSTPSRFLRSPRTWFEDCERTRATITAGPNSGVDLAARASARSAPKSLEVRKLVIGGERVELRTLRSALDTFGPAGLTWGDFLPAYGLAEAVLSVTMPSVGEGPLVRHVSTDALLRGEVEPVPAAANGSDGNGVTTCVSLGRPVGDGSVQVEGGGVGELLVRSASLADGYASDPDLTALRFGPDGLRTGDLGFVVDDQLYVVGRSDDMISLGGRNVFLAEVESRLDQVGGVRRGSSVMVDVPSGDSHRLVMLAEPEPGRDEAELPAVAEAMHLEAGRAGGLRPDECWFLSTGVLPKTPSGKVQRFRCRELVAQGEERVLARIGFD